MLCDGQTWFLPKPRIRFTRSDGDAGFRAVLSVSGLDRYQGLLDALSQTEEVSEAVRPAVLIKAELDVAWALLTHNYDVSEKEFEELVQFSYAAEGEDPQGEEMRDEIMGVAVGRGPKA